MIRTPDIMAYIEHRQRCRPYQSLENTKRKRTVTRENISPNTIWREVAALSAVFGYARQLGIVERNPCLGVKKPKLNLGHPNRTPTVDEVVKIFQYMPERACRFAVALFASGCRFSELSNCDIVDADLKSGRLTITRKGGKVRQVPINDEVRGAIEAELAERPKAKPEEPLFKGKYGGRVKRIRGTLMTACNKAGVPPVTHHSLRHGFASTMKQHTDLLTVSRLMGHSSIHITVNMYIEVPDEGMHEAAQKLTLGVDLSKKVGQKVGHNTPNKSRKKTA